MFSSHLKGKGNISISSSNDENVNVKFTFKFDISPDKYIVAIYEQAAQSFDNIIYVAPENWYHRQQQGQWKWQQ